jgi:membrane protein implicated in regulation of membrane protease activity
VLSSTAPVVSARGRPLCVSTTQRRVRYAFRSTVRREYATSAPSLDSTGSPSATWLRIRREAAVDIEEEDTARMALIVALLLAVFVLPSPWGLVVVILAAGLEIFEIRWGLKLARARSSVGVEALIGKHAEAATDLDPKGQVLVEGERWAAHSTKAVGTGTTVQILAVNGLELEVEPVYPGPRGT